MVKLATKLVETLCPKQPFWRFAKLKKGKLSFPSPTPSMQCCATVRATCRKQSTPQLWMEVGGGGAGIVLFSKVTPFEDNRVVKLHLSVKRQTPICTTWSCFAFTCRLLFIISTHKLVVSRNILSIWIALSSFYLFIFYFEKFLTWIWRLPFAVYVKLKLSYQFWRQLYAPRFTTTSASNEIVWKLRHLFKRYFGQKSSFKVANSNYRHENSLTRR